MKKIGKGYNSKIIIITLSLCLLFNSILYALHSLRPPLATSDTFKKLQLVYGFSTTDPREHDPAGEWAYFTHTGICEDINYNKLMYLYENISRAKEEIFCCYKSSDEFPMTWMAAGFILDVSKDGEVLYAGGVRRVGDHIQPLQYDKKKLAELKVRLRREGRIDTAPSNEVKEMDITGSAIMGICVDMGLIDNWLKRSRADELESFSLLMAMAIKYNLPIVLIHSPVKDIKEHAMFREKFEEILEKYISEEDFKNAILKQIKPELISSQIEKNLPSKELLENS